MVTGGIVVVIRALGALSLINIPLVAMRQRVREIGVRRAVAGFIPALVALRVKVIDAIRF